MRCIICHATETTSSSSSMRHTRAKKGLITYNPAHGTTSIKNHIDSIHTTDFQHYSEAAMAKATAEKQSRRQTKKKKTMQSSQILDFFSH
jgi:spore cortex formation protein SpoVR/YcgB (stage V sporulation)